MAFVSLRKRRCPRSWRYYSYNFRHFLWDSDLVYSLASQLPWTVCLPERLWFSWRHGMVPHTGRSESHLWIFMNGNRWSCSTSWYLSPFIVVFLGKKNRPTHHTALEKQSRPLHYLDVSLSSQCTGCWICLNNWVFAPGTGMIRPCTLPPSMFCPCTVWYVPLCYFSAFLRPRLFHPWSVGTIFRVRLD